MPVTRLDLTEKGSDATITCEANAATWSSASNVARAVIDDQGFSSGKLFFEVFVAGNAGAPSVVGVADDNFDATSELNLGSDANGWGYRENGSTLNNGSTTGYGDSWSSGDVISVAVDIDNGNIWFAKNGTWQNGATQGEIEADDTTNAAFSSLSFTTPVHLGGSRNANAAPLNNAGFVFNFGQFGTSCATVPSGYSFPDSVVEYPTISDNGLLRFDWSDANSGGTLNGDTFSHGSAFLLTDDNSVRAAGNPLSGSGRALPMLRTGADFGAAGHYYFEFEITDKLTTGTERSWVGFAEDSATDSSEDIPDGSGGEGGGVDFSNGTIYDTAGDTTFDIGGTPSATDIIQFAVDVAAGEFWVGINGTYVNSGDPATNTNPTGTFTDPGDLRAMVLVTPYDANVDPGNEDIIAFLSSSGEWNFSAPSGYGELPAPPSPKTGDGALDIEISIAATGDDPHQHGDGALGMAMSITATGDDPNQFGDGDVGLAILISASGTNVNKHGDGNVPISISIAATGTNDIIHGDGALDLSISIAATGIASLTTGSCVLPLLDVNGTILRGNAASGSLSLPKLNVTAAGQGSTGIQGNNVQLPKFATNGLVEGPQTQRLPKLQVNGTMLRGGKLSGTHNLPQIQTNGVADNPVVITGSARLPRLRTTGTMQPGTAISGSIVLPKLDTSGVIQPNNLISGSLTLPALRVYVDTDEALYPLSAGSVSQGLVILPKLQVSGSVENAVTLTYTAWTMNTESFETGNYDNYDFLSLVSYNNQPYGVTSSGIFLLEGDDDDGTNIDAEFLTGIEDFTVENIKMLDRLYIALSRGSNLVLRLFVDGQTRVREYDLTRDANTTGARHAIFKGAKGLRSRSFQIGIKNQGGSDFLIDKLSYLFRRLRRKTRKY